MTDAATLSTPASATDEVRPGKTPLRATRGEWVFAAVYMFSLSLAGMSVVPAWALIVFMLFRAAQRSREEVIVQLGILLTCNAFIPVQRIPFSVDNPIILACLLCLFFYRKNVEVKRITIAIFLYIAYMVVMMFLSHESIAIQWYTLRQYSMILTFIIPLMLFANRPFDIMEFYRKALMYTLVICAFYAIDALVLGAALLVPSTRVTGAESTWDAMVTGLSWTTRRYPHGMFGFLMCMWPLARHYSFSRAQWALFGIAVFITRSMTFLAALVLPLVLFQGKFKQFMKWVTVAAVVLLAATWADRALLNGSLRINHIISQFEELSGATDDEDLAAFGSGRMAQVLPKLEAQIQRGYLWQGFGFVHAKHSTDPLFRIENDLYADDLESDESVANTELTQFNTIIHLGIIGLVLQILFYLALYYLIRRDSESGLYLCAITGAFIMGLGGSSGLTNMRGLIWIAFCLAAILLWNRPGNCAEEEKETTLPTSTTA